jgi:hypothetical protein
MKDSFICSSISNAFLLSNETTEAAPNNAIAKRGCASQEVLEAQLKADPTLALRMNEIALLKKQC